MPHRITGPRGRVSMSELAIGNKKPNLISMILRKTKTYNHMSFNEIRNFYRNNWLVNKQNIMRTIMLKIEKKNFIVVQVSEVLVIIEIVQKYF